MKAFQKSRVQALRTSLTRSLCPSNVIKRSKKQSRLETILTGFLWTRTSLTALLTRCFPGKGLKWPERSLSKDPTQQRKSRPPRWQQEAWWLLLKERACQTVATHLWLLVGLRYRVIMILLSSFVGGLFCKDIWTYKSWFSRVIRLSNSSKTWEIC